MGIVWLIMRHILSSVQISDLHLWVVCIARYGSGRIVVPASMHIGVKGREMAGAGFLAMYIMYAANAHARTIVHALRVWMPSLTW